MPNDYNQPPIPYLPSDYNPYIPYDSKKAKLGLIIGSLLSGGLSAAGGQNAGDAIVRGIAGGLGGLGQGTNFLQNWNTQAIQNDRTGSMIRNQMLQDELARKRYDMDVEQWQTMKPYYESLTQSRTPSLTDQMLGRKRERQELRGQSLENQTKAERLKLLREGKMDVNGEFRKPYYTYAKEYTTPEGKTYLMQHEAAQGKFLYTDPETGQTFNTLPTGAKEKPKVNPTLSAEQGRDIAGLDSLQKDINELRTKFTDSKGGYTGWQAPVSKIGEYIPQSFGGTSRPNREFRAVYNRLFKNMFAEGGKQLTEQEKKILRPLFPNINKPDEQFMVDLDNLESEYSNLKQSRLKTFGDIGYRNMEEVSKGLTPSNKEQGATTAEEYLKKFK